MKPFITTGSTPASLSTAAGVSPMPLTSTARQSFKVSAMVHHRLHRHVEALHVGAAVAGGGDRDDRGRFSPIQLPAKLLNQTRHVVADGLGETGGSHPDEAGPILVHDVLEAGFEVGPAAIDGVLLPQGRRRNVDGLPEMADDIAPHIGGATLGAVEKGHRPFPGSQSPAWEPT